jgi:hypothetical protein
MAVFLSAWYEWMQTIDQTPRSSPDLRELRGARPFYDAELRTRLTSGARCVRFEYCFSLILFTVRRQSPVYLTDSWQQRYLLGLWYSLLALVLGPWGVPWGLLWTPWAVWVNTTGGADCTDSIAQFLDTASEDAQRAAQRGAVNSP